MNIHDAHRYGPRPKGYKARKTSCAPRTRAGQTYPGGRPLRRALARLSAATAFYEKAITGGGKGKSKGSDAFTKPGAMKP
jgi:hypothetical protein